MNTEENILALEERQDHNLTKEIKQVKRHCADIEDRNESMQVIKIDMPVNHD